MSVGFPYSNCGFSPQIINEILYFTAICTGIEKIPVIQRNILKKSKKYGAKIAVATNFLESMIENSYPTRAEVNDIYNTIEMGAKFLVLAAETAIGKYPKDCIILLKKIIKEFKKEN